MAFHIPLVALAFAARMAYDHYKRPKCCVCGCPPEGSMKCCNAPICRACLNASVRQTRHGAAVICPSCPSVHWLE